jgi:S-adenosylmethionine:tRNA ribosyltransferase-isomerase
MNPRGINIKDFSYELPDDKIAKFPLKKRDESKLLIYKNEKIGESLFKNIDTEIPENALIIFNNTRVIHARLLFKRASGAQIEVFCIEPLDHLDYQLAFASKETCTWKCMVGNAKRWKEGEILTKDVVTPNGTIQLTVEQQGKSGELFVVKFSWNEPELFFAEVLHHAGILPLPPYLNRDTEVSDEERYQTIYAKIQGSVAAPTAGLHFTDEVFEKLAAKNITRDEVTLHVGAGTFKPVKSETLAEHEMHEETLFVTLSTLKNIYSCLNENRSLVAVGTTSTRTLESLYWHGVKLIQHSAKDLVDISQWTPYETDTANISASQSIKAIIDRLEAGNETVLQGSTQIIIAPGYTFKIVNVLITNFHQPENTLILLIAAFAGKDWKNIYEYALQNNYRFLSYGDSSILFNK